MKRRIVLFASLTLLSFFFVIGATAQDKAQEVKKVVKKTELVKKDIPTKCLECPSLEKCMGKDANGNAVKTTTACKGTAGCAAAADCKDAANCKGAAECTEAKGAACCSGAATAVDTKKKAKASKLK